MTDLNPEGLVAAEAQLWALLVRSGSVPAAAADQLVPDWAESVVRAYVGTVRRRPTTPDGGWCPLPGEEVLRKGSGEIGTVLALYTDLTRARVSWFHGEETENISDLQPLTPREF